MANNGVRNLLLQLQTKLSLPLFTGKKIEGEKGARIYVALIDANTGDTVTSGPESSIKLDVVVPEGDFNKDDQENWAQEEFEKYVAKERAGKGPLLTGDLLVTLKGGVGELGDLIFTDNSSWNRSQRFRIGLKVASAYCGNTRIQEAATDAFRVKEHRGECPKRVCCLGQWRAIFERFDRDRSGKTDLTELRNALYSLGYVIPPSVLQVLMSKYDDSSGRTCELNVEAFVECGMLVYVLYRLYELCHECRIHRCFNG